MNPDPPSRGDRFTIEGIDYEVTAILGSASTAEPDVIHFHLVLRALPTKPPEEPYGN